MDSNIKALIVNKFVAFSELTPVSEPLYAVA